MFKLKITLGNAEMMTKEHVAHALRDVARRLDSGDIHSDSARAIRDFNGNTVGHWVLVLPDREED